MNAQDAIGQEGLILDLELDIGMLHVLPRRELEALAQCLGDAADIGQFATLRQQVQQLLAPPEPVATAPSSPSGPALDIRPDQGLRLRL